MRRGAVLAVLILNLTDGAFAESFSWHTFEGQVVATPRWELIAHSRLRTRRHFNTFDDGRAGGIVRFNALPHLRLSGGIYFQETKRDDLEMVPSRRVFAGAEVPWSWNSKTMTLRSVVERFVGGIRPDYTRHRHSLRTAWTQRKLAPFVISEWLFVRQGIHSSRNSAGIQLKPAPHMLVEVGYLVDIRREFWGGNRHALVTTVRFQRAER